MATESKLVNNFDIALIVSEQIVNVNYGLRKLELNSLAVQAVQNGSLDNTVTINIYGGFKDSENSASLVTSFTLDGGQTSAVKRIEYPYDFLTVGLAKGAATAGEVEVYVGYD